MSDVLLRDVPDDELAELKQAAAQSSRSLQRYLIDEVVGQHVAYLRRLRAIDAAERRLAGRAPVGDAAMSAVWNTVDDELAAGA